MKPAFIRLVEPDLHYKEAFFRYCEAFHAANEPPRPLEELAYQDFPAFLQKVRNRAQGIDVPEGYVPGTVYWLYREQDQTILGNSSLRHWLTPTLEMIGGHIGYAIHPFERKKGYGTLILRLTLEKAREMGLTRVLVTCDTDNTGSARVIENNGGVLADQTRIGRSTRLISRYWIEL